MSDFRLTAYEMHTKTCIQFGTYFGPLDPGWTPFGPLPAGPQLLHAPLCLRETTIRASSVLMLCWGCTPDAPPETGRYRVGILVPPLDLVPSSPHPLVEVSAYERLVVGASTD